MSYRRLESTGRLAEVSSRGWNGSAALRSLFSTLLKGPDNSPGGFHSVVNTAASLNRPFTSVVKGPFELLRLFQRVEKSPNG